MLIPQSTAKQMFFEKQKANFPNLNTFDEIVKVIQFRDNPAKFMADFAALVANLADPSEYAASVKDLLNRGGLNPYHIQARIILDKTNAGTFVALVYPEWAEWWENWRLANDREQFIRDVNTTAENVVDPAQKEAYIDSIKNLIKTKLPENWPETISKETVAKWGTIFLVDEMEAEQAQMAAFDLENIKNQKMIGWAILGVIGVFGGMALLRKRK